MQNTENVREMDIKKLQNYDDECVIIAVYDDRFLPIDRNGCMSTVGCAIHALPEQGFHTMHVFAGDPTIEKLVSGSEELEIVCHRSEDVYGTAGCLRQLDLRKTKERIVLLPPNLRWMPNLHEMIRLHCDGHCAVTVFTAGKAQIGGEEVLSGAYLLEHDALNYVPEGGYWDIQENLIPELAVLGKRISICSMPHEMTVSIDCGLTRDEYRADGNHKAILGRGTKLQKIQDMDKAEVWAAPNTFVANTAKLYDRVVLQENASVFDEAVVIGPVVISEGTKIAPRSVVTSHTDGNPVDVSNGLKADLQQITNHNLATIRPCLKVIVFVLLAAGVLYWSHRSTIVGVYRVWMQNDEYSSGLLVPLLALYVLWGRRNEILVHAGTPCIGLGILVMLASESLRYFGLHSMYIFLERLALVVGIWALVLWMGGWRVFVRMSSILLFLLLMLPWPTRVQHMVTMPLQRWATDSAVFCLEVLGYPVVQEGNTIHIGETIVAVAEACNGLRMITAFIVIGALVALLAKKTWLEKLIILMSCIPIALICNTIRLTATSIAFTKINVAHWEMVFHDFGGYAMMPLAIGLVMFELYLLKVLFKQDGVVEEKIIVRRSQSAT